MPRRRPARRGRSGQGGLDPAQQGRKRRRVGRRERRDERLESGPDEPLGRVQEPLAGRGQGQLPPAAVAGCRRSRDHACALEPCHEL
jgi:hypothetical protein